jgi:hypothetical protein
LLSRAAHGVHIKTPRGVFNLELFPASAAKKISQSSRKRAIFYMAQVAKLNFMLRLGGTFLIFTLRAAACSHSSAVAILQSLIGQMALET